MWILIVLLMAGNGQSVSVSMQEFESLKACNEAAVTIRTMARALNGSSPILVSASCMTKGNALTDDS